MNAKKIASTLAIAAVGGLISVFVFWQLSGRNIQTRIVENNQPARYVNLSPSGNLVDFTYAAESTVHAVVHVKTQSYAQNTMPGGSLFDFFFGPGPYNYQQQPQMGFGSGVIISEDGYIVTNNHVIDRSENIEVVLNDKRTYTAKVIGTDPSTDIALLKIDEKDLPFIPYGNSDSLKIGEWVLAVGNPYNLTSTVTAGIVSAKARNINLLRDQFAVESFIQTDAAVNPGNSGGALVNIKGELVGINTAIASATGSYSGTSFAIPVDIARKVIRDLIEFGEVQRAILGVSIREVNADLAKEKGLKKIEGVYIDEVRTGSAAEEAGLKTGDVVLKVNDIKVNTSSELQEQVSRYRPKDKISLTVLRGSETKQIEVTLRNMQGDTNLVKRDEAIAALGATFKAISNDDKRKLNITGGVQVKTLNAGKLRKAGVEEGFIILSINNKAVSSVDDIKAILEKVEKGVYIEGIYPSGEMAYYAFGL